MRGDSFFFVHTTYLKIEQLVKSSDHSLDPWRREMLQTVHNHVESLLEISKRTLHTKFDEEINSVDNEVRVIADRIEGGAEFSIEEVENLKQKMNSLAFRLEMLQEQFVDGLYDSFPDDEKDDNAVSPKVIGVHDVRQQLKNSLMSDVVVTALVGMPGSGKTAVAKQVFQDPAIVERFGGRRVWVRVGKGCRLTDIPLRILSEMMDHEMCCDVKERLESEACLVVLDDVWDTRVSYFLYYFLSVYGTASRILVLSRLHQTTRHINLNTPVVITMRLMDKDESWELLQDKVFSQLSCPDPQLQKAGEKIAEKCEGLPLTIITVAQLLSNEEKILEFWKEVATRKNHQLFKVAHLLSNEEKTLEFWKEVATRKNHQLFKDAYDRISEVLLPSYTYLPRILQICFLFMGLFRQSYKIPRSKLVNLWRADGFDEINFDVDLDSNGIGCLEELVYNSLVMVYQKSTYNMSHTVKTCGLHSSLWHLSNKKAMETNFSIILDSLDDGLDDAMRDHCRLSFHNNVLFGIKDVRESVEDKCGMTTRSLLCYGPYQQYQVPMCYGLKMLKELDAVSIRFYEFPLEVLQLVELRYLTLTLNGLIPSSISRLSKLQFLVVDRHLNISSGTNVPSYLPVEIWELKELKHLQVMGSDLPDPCGASLDKLSALLDVSASSCNEAVLKAIPYLDELRVRIELAPDDDAKVALSFFQHISHLSYLNFLKCVIVNPGIARPVVSFSGLEHLTNLSLNGLGCSWNEISKIGLLKNLYVLKLKNYAFRGPKWDVEEATFPNLECLVIEDTDMVDWVIGCEAFRTLSHLSMKHCYKLEKIHGTFDDMIILKIELFDCNPLCVEEMRRAMPQDTDLCVLYVRSTWEDTKD